MPTTAQLNYAKYLISRLNVSKQMKNELNNEVESMNLDTAITFIDDLKKGNLLEWEMKWALDVALEEATVIGIQYNVKLF